MTARDLIPIAVLTVLAALLPLAVTSSTVLNFLVFTLIVSLGAQGWNILGGFGGQFSFGHAAFFGTGAYVTAILQLRYGVNAWAGLALATTAGALVGWVIGFLSFRSGLRGSYFALVTLAFAEVFRILANAASVTGGAAGLLIKLDVRPANLQFDDRAVFYWLVLAFVAATLLLTRWIQRSRFGAQLVAVRENEDAAKALGVNSLTVKLRAIALSGGVTALSGCLYAQYFLYIDANIAYGSWISVELLLAPIIGGVGTVFGPVVGALTLHGLGEVAKQFAGRIPGIDLIVFGGVLVLAVAFARGGILGLLERLRDRGRGMVTRGPKEVSHAGR
ncbi:branched-chain amino acid ABC transporter permease (plasmid) [Azospirillum humicireducens]|uniref:Branched-chain amino acid ABC transporter permease n=1 Tax=Azospirillum humicireducens TaxID=1226968 RepID=A0A2R4VT70_9PROT|nr:branched-chain amino acid ABC transporter permease [Azospirillum humicireducens]AWB07648.1 branched-chain amino acid ABC transporter permease [Azospirillum humicireducens]